jgi:hypothetical protein
MKMFFLSHITYHFSCGKKKKSRSRNLLMKKAPPQKHLALIMQDGMHYYKKNVLKNGM